MRWMVAVLAVLVTACGAQDEVLPKTLVEVQGVKEVLQVKSEVASTDAARERGLMFRKNMAEEEGMLFVWPGVGRRIFWMRNTLIPLDMVFIQHGKVVGIVPWARPLDETPLDPGVDSDAVLEVNGGWAARHGVVTGAAVKAAGWLR